MNHSIFDFLRFSLDNTVEPPTSIKDIKRFKLLDFAGKHAIIGILFEGIKRLEDMSRMRGRDRSCWHKSCRAVTSDIMMREERT